MSVYKFEETRNFDEPLTIERFNKLVSGMIMATGVGDYPNLIIKDYHGNKRWLAVKATDGKSWCIYYGKEKQVFEYIKFNENKLEDLEVARQLVNCTDEVLNMYQYD